MDWTNPIAQVFAGALLSTIFSIVFVLWTQRIQLPRLSARIESPTLELNYPDSRPARIHRASRLIIQNGRMPFLLRFVLSRSAAQNCRAHITFHNIADGTRFFSGAMTGRWAHTPQPIPMQGMLGEQVFLLWDTQRLTTDSVTDIPSGENVLLDIAARFDEEMEAYGWNNEAYFSPTLWRARHWMIPQGRYIIRVQIIAANTEHITYYRLLNEGARTNFRLEPATDEDIERASR